MCGTLRLAGDRRSGGSDSCCWEQEGGRGLWGEGEREEEAHAVGELALARLFERASAK